MKLRIYSDIHIEFIRNTKYPAGMNAWAIPVMPCDHEIVLVLAGDIDVGKHTAKFVDEMAARFKAVVYVLGNHDVWTQNIDKAYDKARATADNAYLLQNDAVTIDGVEFLGTTLWTDINRADPFDVWDAKQTMNDFSKIKQGENYERFTPARWMYENKVARAFLAANIDADKKQVVVTHHAPDYVCGLPLKDRIAAYYYNRDMEDLLLDAGTWVYGHTHYCEDMVEGATRIINNSRGYDIINEPWYLADGFKKDGVFYV
jgi:glyoxylase-like metal-dependent hydrolase (beta-lactamase superfamily II)